MRLKPEEVKKLSTLLVDKIMGDSAVTVKTTRQNLLLAVEGSLNRHFDEERQLEQKAEKLLQAQGNQGHDRGKALAMIRRQLAKENNFILSGAQDGRFSQDKVFHFSHLVADRIYDDDLADFVDEDEGGKYVKRVFMEYFAKENQATEKARKKILSLANPPFEGSREWETIYRKYVEEELARLGH